jgi:hypothetical protein
MRRLVLLSALLGYVAVALASCGGSATSKQTTPAASKLQREDLAAAGKALAQSQTAVAAEVVVTRAAWAPIADGSTARLGAVSSSPSALAKVTQLPVPALFGEVQSRTLTGPASQIAGLFRTSALLSTRGWKMLIASSQAIASGSPAAARFARENVALYIESIYDGHFALAQIGKKLLAGYEKLGGASGFGSSLTRSEIDALTQAYSEPRIRLYPHVRVRIGS